MPNLGRYLTAQDIADRIGTTVDEVEAKVAAARHVHRIVEHARNHPHPDMPGEVRALAMGFNSNLQKTWGVKTWVVGLFGTPTTPSPVSAEKRARILASFAAYWEASRGGRRSMVKFGEWLELHPECIGYEGVRDAVTGIEYRGKQKLTLPEHDWREVVDGNRETTFEALLRAAQEAGLIEV